MRNITTQNICQVDILCQAFRRCDLTVCGKWRSMYITWAEWPNDLSHECWINQISTYTPNLILLLVKSYLVLDETSAKPRYGQVKSRPKSQILCLTNQMQGRLSQLFRKLRRVIFRLIWVNFLSLWVKFRVAIRQLTRRRLWSGFHDDRGLEAKGRPDRLKREAAASWQLPSPNANTDNPRAETWKWKW